LLQDDTGIPFRDFDQHSWDRYTFGTYTEPTLPMFRGYRQQNMANFFKGNEKVDIPFKIGYGFHQKRPNLLLAISKKNKPRDEHGELVDDKSIMAEVNAMKKLEKSECKFCDDGKNENHSADSSIQATDKSEAKKISITSG
jgi:hypothetical protein